MKKPRLVDMNKKYTRRPYGVARFVFGCFCFKKMNLKQTADKMIQDIKDEERDCFIGIINEARDEFLMNDNVYQVLDWIEEKVYSDDE